MASDLPIAHGGMVSSRLPLTQSVLKFFLDYDPDTGRFVWLVDRGNKIKAGSEAGSLNSDGYVVIRVCNKVRGAGRLAWLYMTGELPAGEVDHINRDKTDNRWANLRLANRSQNVRNVGVRKDNRSGIKGVRQLNGRWQARIRHNGVSHYLGTFGNIADAKAAYEAAAVKLHGPFAHVRS